MHNGLQTKKIYVELQMIFSDFTVTEVLTLFAILRVKRVVNHERCSIGFLTTFMLYD